MKPGKRQRELEAKWVGKRVLARFVCLPDNRGEPCTLSDPEPGVITCICDNSADLEGGDRRRRSVPTGTAMLRPDRRSAQCEYEVWLEHVVLANKEITPRQES